jgi:hypothetical protein
MAPLTPRDQQHILGLCDLYDALSQRRAAQALFALPAAGAGARPVVAFTPPGPTTTGRGAALAQAATAAMQGLDPGGTALYVRYADMARQAAALTPALSADAVFPTYAASPLAQPLAAYVTDEVLTQAASLPRHVCIPDV